LANRVCILEICQKHEKVVSNSFAIWIRILRNVNLAFGSRSRAYMRGRVDLAYRDLALLLRHLNSRAIYFRADPPHDTSFRAAVLCRDISSSGPMTCPWNRRSSDLALQMDMHARRKKKEASAAT
jgi:hypothetical protein